MKYETVISYLLKFVGGLTLIFFLYGLVRFPDSPIKPCGEGKYCGKQGQARTENDFRAYRQWSTVNMISFPLTLILLFADKRNREKRKMNGSLDED